MNPNNIMTKTKMAEIIDDIVFAINSNDAKELSNWSTRLTGEVNGDTCVECGQNLWSSQTECSGCGRPVQEEYDA